MGQGAAQREVVEHPTLLVDHPGASASWASANGEPDSGRKNPVCQTGLPLAFTVTKVMADVLKPEAVVLEARC